MNATWLLVIRAILAALGVVVASQGEGVSPAVLGGAGLTSAALLVSPSASRRR